MIHLLPWWLGLELVSIAALPLTSILFPGHRLHSYPFSKVFGVLAIGLTSWLLAMLKLANFSTGGGILGALIILLIIGSWLLRREGLKQLVQDLKCRWKRILGWELLFALSLIFGLLLRLYSGLGPGISSTEKLMDLAMISGIFQSASMPPQDPWLADFAINYYYLGYLLVAMLARLTGIGVSVAFNLALATIFSLSCVTSVGVVLMLITSPDKRGYQNTFLQAVIPAVSVVLILLFLGNQAGAIQVLLRSPSTVSFEFKNFLTASTARLAGKAKVTLPEPFLVSKENFGEIHEIDFTQPYTFNWWWPSRAVWDNGFGDQSPPLRRYNITEFPFFSFYLGDLHPHIIAIPFGLLALALAAQVLTSHRRDSRSGDPAQLARQIMTGAVLGSLYAINSWDAPTYILLFVGVSLVAFRHSHGNLNSLSNLKKPLQELFPVAGAAIGVLIPFLFTFDSFAGGAYLPEVLQGIPLISSLGRVIAPVTDHTSFFELLVMFGPSSLLLLGYLLLESVREPSFIEGKKGYPRSLSVVKGLWMASAVSAFIGVLIGMPLLSFIFLIALCLYLLWKLPSNPVRSFILISAIMGALMVLVADIVYLRDPFENRMNTVFKFYYQTWVLWGTAGALVIWKLVSHRYRIWQKLGVGLPVLLLVLTGCIYPLEAIRSGPRWSLPLPSLDGIAYLLVSSPDEYAAIQWILENTRSDDVILTADGQSYDYQTSVIAAATGRPTLLGWSSSHERLWRRNQADATDAINTREQVVPLIYSTSDPIQAMKLLKEQDTSFVYIGPTEQQRYPASGLKKFERMFEEVFHQGSVSLYQVKN